MSAWRKGLLELLEKSLDKMFADLYEPFIMVAKVMVQCNIQIVLVIIFSLKIIRKRNLLKKMKRRIHMIWISK